VLLDLLDVTYSDYGSPARARAAALAIALLARAITNVVFAVWLATRAPVWGEIFRVGSLYALVDGGCALAAALLVDAFARQDVSRVLGAITIADALARIATGIGLRLLPGLADFPVALLAFFAAIAAATVTLGVGALGLWLYVRAHAGFARTKHADGLLDPLALAALISFGVGYVLFLRPPATAQALRDVALGASATLSLVFGVAFVGAIVRVTGSRRRTRRTGVSRLLGHSPREDRVV
jgi:hypothetical protein